MHQVLKPNSEHLVVFEITETEIAQKIAELEEMRQLISNATVRSVEARPSMYELMHPTPNEVLSHTLFVQSPESYIVARISGTVGEAFSIYMSYGDVPINKFRAERALHQMKIGISDCTLPGLENDVPVMSKERAIATINRWIVLLQNPLPQNETDKNHSVATDCARDFIGSVADYAAKHDLMELVTPEPDEYDDDYEFKAQAKFPSFSGLPQILIDDNCHGWHRLLQSEAAAIYACALPIILDVRMTYTSGDGHHPGEPFGLYFSTWLSPRLPFVPSKALDSILATLPRMPVDSIKLPNFAKD